jgi:4-hydroxy-tetrahydrodipicolinate reductase
MADTTVALLGASGRMGRAILALLRNAQDLKLTGASVSPASELLGQDAGLLAGAPCGVMLVADPAAAINGADVVIDFTVPATSLLNVAACQAAGKAIVIGTTGFDPDGRGALAQAALSIPVLVSPNMSVGVNLLYKLAQIAAAALDSTYDIEIFEAHHRHKRDAPSGTAIKIGEVAAAARGTTLASAADYSRSQSSEARRPGSIGFSVARGGDIVGDHMVMFAGPGERIELVHRAQDRAAFAQGAIKAARWLAGRPAGMYSMQDVLGLGSLR